MWFLVWSVVGWAGLGDGLHAGGWVVCVYVYVYKMPGLPIPSSGTGKWNQGRGIGDLFFWVVGEVGFGKR